MTLDREEFIEKLQLNSKTDIEVIRNKNSDYAADMGPFHNFKMVEASGITSTEKGIATRMMDKMQRVINLLDKPAKVDDETVADTLSDLRNYANILQVYLEEEK